MLALLLAIAGSAQPLAPRHHGLFVHSDLGFGYFSSSASNATVTGPGGAFNLAVGAGVAPNLAVYATLFDAVTAQPKVTVTGVTSSPRDWDVATVALGAGVAWYLMPWNFYLTLAAGAGPLMITEGSKTYTSHSGFVGRAGAGKEWFVSESWGLGAALFVTMATHEDQGADARVWRTVSPVLALSVTFY